MDMSELQNYMLSFFGSPLRFNKDCTKPIEEVIKDIEKENNNEG